MSRRMRCRDFTDGVGDQRWILEAGFSADGRRDRNAGAAGQRSVHDMGVLGRRIFSHPGRTLETEMDVWSASGLTGPLFLSAATRRDEFCGRNRAAEARTTVEQAAGPNWMRSPRTCSKQQYPNEYPAARGGRCGWYRFRRTW